MGLTANQIQKYKAKSIPWLIKKAEEVFNRFIRERDSSEWGFTCISCNEQKPLSQLNAGHYLSAGNHAATRFMETNVHGQCIKCNNFLSGNLLHYRENLIKKIGIEEVQKIEMVGKLPFKWDRFELIAIIVKYQALVKK